LTYLFNGRMTVLLKKLPYDWKPLATKLNYWKTRSLSNMKSIFSSFRSDTLTKEMMPILNKIFVNELFPANFITKFYYETYKQWTELHNCITHKKFVNLSLKKIVLMSKFRNYILIHKDYIFAIIYFYSKLINAFSNWCCHLIIEYSDYLQMRNVSNQIWQQ
jgi:hypothetical protein